MVYNQYYLKFLIMKYYITEEIYNDYSLDKITVLNFIDNNSCLYKYVYLSDLSIKLNITYDLLLTYITKTLKGKICLSEDKQIIINSTIYTPLLNSINFYQHSKSSKKLPNNIITDNDFLILHMKYKFLNYNPFQTLCNKTNNELYSNSRTTDEMNFINLFEKVNY